MRVAHSSHIISVYVVVVYYFSPPAKMGGHIRIVMEVPTKFPIWPRSVVYKVIKLTL